MHKALMEMNLRGFKVSMRGKGNCYDNTTVETFFKTIKAELIWPRSWETRRQAGTAIFQYINGVYNPRRRNSASGGKSAAVSSEMRLERAPGAAPPNLPNLSAGDAKGAASCLKFIVGV